MGVLYPTTPRTRTRAPQTAPTAVPRAAPGWRSSSRPRAGLRAAHSRPSELGKGVGEVSGHGNAADPVHRVAEAGARLSPPPSELCLWASPVLSKGRGRLARRWEWRVSRRESPPHPNAVLCAPAPSKLRPGKGRPPSLLPCAHFALSRSCVAMSFRFLPLLRGPVRQNGGAGHGPLRVWCSGATCDVCYLLRGPLRPLAASGGSNLGAWRWPGGGGKWIGPTKPESVSSLSALKRPPPHTAI